MKSSNDRLVEIFLEVAAIDGLSGKERGVADRVLAFLRDLGLDPQEDDAGARTGGNAGNVVCAVAGGGDRVLLCHMDTARSTAGVQPRVLDDRIVSDGTTVLGVDNRVGVAVLLHAAERVVRDGLASPGFTLGFTICEETTLAGSRSIRLSHGVEHGFVFDSALRPGHFIDRTFGAIRFRAEVRGKAAHSGLAPEKGIDAILAASRAISRLPLGRIDETTTANVGFFRGGSGINVVPDRAVVEGEVRAREEDRATEVLEEYRAAFEREGGRSGAEIELTSTWDFRPFSLDPDSAVCREARRAIEAAGLEPKPALSAGGSDANSLNARGVPSVNLGVGAQNPHTNEEFVLLEDLAAAGRVALALATP